MMGSPGTATARRPAVLACLAMAALAAFGVWQCVVAASGEAPDHRVYVAGIAALADGADPYAPGVLQRYGSSADLSLAYPPLTAHALGPLVHLGYEGVAIVYAGCLLLAAVMLGYVFLPRRPDWLCGLAAFAVTGFAAARWNFQTGNLGLIELLLFTLACIAAHRHRLRLFAAIIGSLAFVKILPITFLALLVPLVRGRQASWHVLLWPLVVCACLHAVSYAAFPELTASWIAMLEGGAHGQHTPLAERISGNNNPTFLLLLHDLVGLEAGFGTGDVAMLALAAVALWVGWRALRVLLQERTVSAALPLAAIALLLSWPRLKPYSYGYALVAVTIGAGAGSSRRALWLLAGLGLIPAAMPWSPNLPVDALQLMKRNHLAVLLLAAGVVFAWPRRTRP